MSRQSQARAASDSVAPRDLDASDISTYEQQFEGDDLDPKQLQEAAGQKKGILRRLLNKFKRKLTSNGAGGGLRYPPSPKQTPRSPARRSPSAVKSATAVRAAASGCPTASARRSPAHMATLPPWKQPNSGSNANNTAGSTGSNSAGVAAADAAAPVGSGAMAGHSTTPASGSDAAPAQLTPRGGGGTARSPTIRSGLGYTGPSSPGAIAARPRPQFGTASSSSSGGGANGPKTQVSPGCDAEAAGRRRSQRGGGEGSEGRGVMAAAAPVATRAEDDRGYVTPERIVSPLPAAYDTLYGVEHPGGCVGGSPDIAFSEVLLSEMAPLRCVPSGNLPAPPGGLGGAAGVQHAVFPDDRGARDGRDLGVVPYPAGADGGRGHHARRRSSSRPQGGAAAVAAAALTATVNDGAAGGTASGGGGGTLGAEAIAGELSALISSLDEELASVAAAKSKHTLRLKLVGSLLEMMPSGSGDHLTAAGTSGALGGRLAAERERLVSDLEELSAREKLLSFARREWGKVMAVMSGVRVSRKQAGPLQAILFSDTLARIRAFQKAQAKRKGRRVRGGARGPAAALTSASSHVQEGYAQSASSLAGRWQSHQQHQVQPQSQSQSQPRFQAQTVAALGQASGGQGVAVASGIRRRGVQRSSSGTFASQHQQPGVRVGPHHPHAMYAHQQQSYLLTAGMGGGSGGPSLKGPGPHQLLPPHHLVLAPITEDDCSPQKQPQLGPSAQYGEPYWVQEHVGPSEAQGAVPALRLGGFAGGNSSTGNVQLWQQQQQPHQRGYVPNRYHQQPHHLHPRQNPYQKVGGRGGYGGGSAYGSTHGSVYDDGAYSDSGSSCSSGEMYRSIASLARNTVDGDDDFGDDRLREVEESYEHNEDGSQLPALPPPQHRQRRHQLHQQLPPPEPYNSGVRSSSGLQMTQFNTTAAAARADDDNDDDDDASCSSSGSLESAFITKCLTYTRNSLDIRGRAGGGGGAGASAAAAASAASAAALAAAAAAAGGMSRLSRADRLLYSSAIQTLRANVLNTANGNAAGVIATLTTGAGVTGMTLDTAAGVAGSPADANARSDFDPIGVEADVVYGNIERRDDGYFDVGPGGPHGRGVSRGGGDLTATPTSATVLASSTNASSLGSVEDMLAAVAMLQGGGVGSGCLAQEATWR